jgi:putative transposase
LSSTYSDGALDILVTSRRDAKAATRFFRKLLTGLEYAPRVLVTDNLASYSVAHRRLMPGVEHRRSKYLNNRAENSHQPTRTRERAMKRFTSPGHAQRFLSTFSGISPHFQTHHHLLHAQEYRREMTNRFSTWKGCREGSCHQVPFMMFLLVSAYLVIFAKAPRAHHDSQQLPR